MPSCLTSAAVAFSLLTVGAAAKTFISIQLRNVTTTVGSKLLVTYQLQQMERPQDR